MGRKRQVIKRRTEKGVAAPSAPPPVPPEAWAKVNAFLAECRQHAERSVVAERKFVRAKHEEVVGAYPSGVHYALAKRLVGMELQRLGFAEHKVEHLLGGRFERRLAAARAYDLNGFDKEARDILALEMGGQEMAQSIEEKRKKDREAKAAKRAAAKAVREEGRPEERPMPRERKAKREPREPKEPRRTIGGIVRELIAADPEADAESVGKAVLKEFPASKFGPSHLAWYKADMRKRGLLK